MMLIIIVGFDLVNVTLKGFFSFYSIKKLIMKTTVDKSKIDPVES